MHFQKCFFHFCRRFGSTNNISEFQKILKGDPRLPSYLNTSLRVRCEILTKIIHPIRYTRELFDITLRSIISNRNLIG